MYQPSECQKAFQESIYRMRANYGADKFNQEKCDLIWEELKPFSPKQIRNLCDVVMGDNTYAPNINSFREKAALLREKIRAWEREQERNEAKNFWEGTYLPSDVKMVVQTIRDRIEGACPDPTWLEFQEFLHTHASKTQPARCQTCQDTRITFDSHHRPFLCSCKTKAFPPTLNQTALANTQPSVNPLTAKNL